jgi:hypothetical protein
VAIIHVCITVNKNNNTERPGKLTKYGCAAQPYLVSFNDVTLFSPLSTNTFSQSSSINGLFSFFFSQSSLIITFLIPALAFRAHSL